MTQTVHVTDHQLKTSLTDELEWAPGVDADHIGVSVIDGAVTLAGEVRSYPEKSAAVKAALRVRGVTAIADDLVVKHAFGGCSDADTARDAGTALAAIVSVTSSVKAAGSKHRVTPSGDVDGNYQRDAASRAVASCPASRASRP